MTSLTVEDVGDVTGDSEEEIVSRGIRSYVDQEIRNASARISEIKNEYDVESREQLEQKIESGEVDEHPAWERLIEWENLEERMEKLKQL